MFLFTHCIARTNCYGIPGYTGDLPSVTGKVFQKKVNQRVNVVVD
jgi:hypothetical protein